MATRVFDQWGKPAIISSGVGILGSAAATSIGGVPVFVEWVLGQLGIGWSSLQVAMALLLPPEQAVAWIAWLKGPALPGLSALAFGMFAFTVSKGLRRRLICPFWPDWPEYLEVDLFSKNAKDIDARAVNQPFVGRDDDYQKLLAFARDPAPGLAWITVAGRMGMGKTRLALEAAKALRAEGWTAAMMETAATQERIREAHLPDRCFIIIDEAGAKETGAQSWQKLLEALQLKAGSKRLRVVLTDHTPLELSPGADAALTAAKQEPLILRALDGAARTQMGEEEAGIEPAQAKSGGRPLLIKLGKDPWQEAAKRMAKKLEDAKAVSDDHGARALALAALAGPIPAKDLPGLGLRLNLGQRRKIFESEKRTEVEAGLPQYQPQIFAGEIVLQWAMNQDDFALPEFFAQALAINPGSARALINSIILERPAETSEGQARARERLMAMRPPEWAEQDAGLAGRLGLLLAEMFNQQRSDLLYAEALSGEIGKLTESWPRHHLLARVHAETLRNLIHILGKNPAVSEERLFRAVNNLEKLAKSHETSAEIALVLCHAGGCLFDHAFDGAEPKSDRIERGNSLIEMAAVSHRHDKLIAVAQARGGRGLVTTAAKQSPPDWANVKRGLEILNASVLLHADDESVALELVKAGVDLSFYAGEQVPTDWKRVDEGLDLIKEARSRHPPSASLAYWQAQAGTNLVCTLDRQVPPLDWSRGEQGFALVAEARSGQPQNPSIALKEAEAAFNLAKIAGELNPPDWYRVECGLRSLADARSLHESDAAIALAQAGTGSSIVHNGGRQSPPDWTRVDQGLALLADASTHHSGDSEIGYYLAKTGRCLVHHARDEKPVNWARLDQGLALLVAARERHIEDAKIAMEQAKAWTMYLATLRENNPPPDYPFAKQIYVTERNLEQLFEQFWTDPAIVAHFSKNHPAIMARVIAARIGS